MRFFKRTLPVLLTLSIFKLSGCGPDKPKGTKTEAPEQYTMFIVPSPGQIVKSGDEMAMEVSFAEIPDDFEKLVLKIDNEEIYTVDKAESPVHFDFNTTSLTMGFHVLSSEMHRKSG